MAGSSPLLVDKTAFRSRIQKILDCFKSGNSLNGSSLSEVDAIAVCVGADEAAVYNKSLAIQQWLFGYDLADTVTVLTDQAIYVIASKKKVDFLQPLMDKDVDCPCKIKLLLRNKADNDSENFKKVIEAMKESRKGKNIGVFTKDNFPGAFVESWRKAFDSALFNKVDVSTQIGLLMAVKDETEIVNIKKAAQISSDLFGKYFKLQVVEIVDGDKKVKHSKLSEQIESALESKKYLGPSVDPELVDVCFSPIIQSGGKYNLKFSAQNNEDKLHPGIIICIMGIRYKFYCSSIVRTLLVEPSKEVQDLYEFLLTLFDSLVDKLQHGARLCDIYNSIYDMLLKVHPELKDNFLKSLGFSTGVEFREGILLIDAKNTNIVKEGMAFNIGVGLQDLVDPQAKTGPKNYALFVGDTVLVQGGQPASVLTSSKKQLKNIGIFLKDEEDEAEDNADSEDIQTLVADGKSAVLASRMRNEMTAEERRKTHQEELKRQLNEEARKRLLEDRQSSTDGSKKSNSSVIAYRNVSMVPQEKDVLDLKVFVDKRYDAVVLPMFGSAVPFHISTIKNISSSVEGDYTYLRINLFCPGSGFNKTDSGMNGVPNSSYVKEIVFRSTNTKEPGESTAPSANLNTAFRLIKDLQKKYKSREAEERELEGVVKQEALVVAPGKNNPKLKDLLVRPQLSSKRVTGTLEAHTNGFRYQTLRGEQVDVLYKNIKHAFYQSCDNEMIILIHLHLKNAIIIGKKKYRDIQFYAEVGEIITDLGRGASSRDRDELEGEQAEREMRQKLKMAFKSFCDKLEALTHNIIEFDAPFRELGFNGVPGRSSTLLLPTTNCLVNLVDQPPFIITLDEVELVHFERVQFHLRNFDMVFVFKDYTRKVCTIGAIPMSSLDSVKEWLNSCDIKYTEGPQSLNWTKIMKTITDDPEDFFANGGWSFLDPDSESEKAEDGSSEDDDSAYNPTESEESEDDGDSDEDYDSEPSDDDDEEDSDSGSGEESGKDWDELEAEARRDDAEADMSAEESPKKKKRKPSDHQQDRPAKKKK